MMSPPVTTPAGLPRQGPWPTAHHVNPGSRDAALYEGTDGITSKLQKGNKNKVPALA